MARRETVDDDAEATFAEAIPVHRSDVRTRAVIDRRAEEDRIECFARRVERIGLNVDGVDAGIDLGIQVRRPACSPACSSSPSSTAPAALPRRRVADVPIALRSVAARPRYDATRWSFGERRR